MDASPGLHFPYSSCLLLSPRAGHPAASPVPPFPSHLSPHPCSSNVPRPYSVLTFSSMALSEPLCSCLPDPRFPRPPGSLFEESCMRLSCYVISNSSPWSPGLLCDSLISFYINCHLQFLFWPSIPLGFGSAYAFSHCPVLLDLEISNSTCNSDCHSFMPVIHFSGNGTVTMHCTIHRHRDWFWNPLLTSSVPSQMLLRSTQLWGCPNPPFSACTAATIYLTSHIPLPTAARIFFSFLMPVWLSCLDV